MWCTRLRGHRDQITDIHIMEDSKRIISSSKDKLVKVRFSSTNLFDILGSDRCVLPLADLGHGHTALCLYNQWPYQRGMELRSSVWGQLDGHGHCWARDQDVAHRREHRPVPPAEGGEIPLIASLLPPRP